MGNSEAPLSSGQPDTRILASLSKIQTACIYAACSLAAITFLGWVVPLIGRHLPPFWGLMKVNSTVLTLACCLSLFLWQPRRSQRSLAVARALAVAVILLAGATLAEHFGHTLFNIDTLLAADPTSKTPGRISLQTSWAFLIMGMILTSLRARKRMLANFIDLLALTLTLLIFTFLCGYFFGEFHLYGLALGTPIAPQSLLCVSLLTFVIITRRTEYGIFSILVSSGIGGRTARIAAPWAVCLPFLLDIFRGVVREYTRIPKEYCLSVSASIMSLCGFCLIIALSRRTDRLENAIRELSLRDDLTSLYNRRGFYLLGEQMMRLTHRAGQSFFVLFIDMDNLKVLNDTLGHDVGSEHLKQLAGLIDRTFRETDVVGRLGGDEFVVAGKGDHISLQNAIERLQQQSTIPATDLAPAVKLEFSYGYVVSHRGSSSSLDDLVEQADAIMYETKRKKKQPSTATASNPSFEVALQLPG